MVKNCSACLCVCSVGRRVGKEDRELDWYQGLASQAFPYQSEGPADLLRALTRPKQLPVTIWKDRYVRIILFIHDQTTADHRSLVFSEVQFLASLNRFNVEGPNKRDETITQSFWYADLDTW